MDKVRVQMLGGRVVAMIVTAALVASRSCGESPPRAGAPAIAAAYDRYTVAWMRPAKHGGALLVQQFARDTLKPLGPPHVVVEREDLVGAGIELVAIGGGYIATSRIEDPYGKPSSATLIVAVPLDPEGNQVGDARAFPLMDYACHGAGEIRDHVIMAVKRVARSHRFPKDLLGLLVVDRNGRHQSDRVIASNPIACASAVRGRKIAVAWTRWLETESTESSAGLRIAFPDPFRGDRDDTFVVPVGTIEPWPVRVAPHGDDWAILYSDEDKHLHLAFVDTHGRLLSTRELPREVDRRSVDLDSNARGIFVTWIDGSRVRTLGLDGSSRVHKVAGSRASRTRALGDVASCVAAWTVDNRKRARLVKYSDCP